MHETADHSLRAKRLVDIFDVGDFSALASNPEIKLFGGHRASLHFALVFFFFALFLTGGTLEAYRSSRKLYAREFFEACGSYFWRWARLLILMAFVFVPLLMAAGQVVDGTRELLLNASQEKTGFWLLVAGLGVIGLLFMFVRLWFDMAQVRIVVDEDYSAWRSAGFAFRLTLHNFRSLFWMYFRISFLGWIIFATGLYIWAKMPPARFMWTFLVLEIVVLCGFGTRLWQRACEMIWYQRHVLAAVAAAAAPILVSPVPSSLINIGSPPGQ